ncbi:hypothetical protein [Novosphingobium panipatense]|uniref:hypothetical protein n=1 Tax=Novosphingobium panipatense TaxID=428991 RepID=UPI00360D5F7B
MAQQPRPLTSGETTGQPLKLREGRFHRFAPAGAVRRAPEYIDELPKLDPRHALSRGGQAQDSGKAIVEVHSNSRSATVGRADLGDRLVLWTV